MAYDRILVPLDGSQLAEYILPHAQSVASAFQAEVTLFHVIEAEDVDRERLTPSQRSARSDITKYLQRISEALEQKQVRVNWYVSIGEPASEIVRHAKANDVELVMMSTRGQGRRGGGRLGSVAMDVVSSGAVPVMLVKPPDDVAAR